MSIEYRDLRNQLISFTRKLSDTEYQTRCWINRDFAPDEPYSSFDFALSFILDDMALDEYAYDAIGKLFYDEEEAHIAKELADALIELITVVGDTSAEAHLKSPLWPGVTQLAKRALTLFRQRDAEAQQDGNNES